MFGVSFLVPAFLVGGLAALVPVVLHLRRRERLPRLPFSDVRFLRGAPVEQARRRRLREWLLLALRMLALLLLALAFARPFLSDTVSSSQTATVVLVDTSFSMSTPPQVARARALSLEAIETAPDGHLVGVVAFDEEARVVAELGTRAAAGAAVESVVPGVRGTRYATGLMAASTLLGAGGGRIVVVTDLQSGGWDAGQGHVSPGVDVAVSDVGTPAGNLAVLSIEPVPGATVAVLFRSGAVADEVTAELAVDGEVLAALALTPALGRAEVQFPVVLPDAGVATVSVTDGVGYEVDDRRYRLLDPPDPALVLLVADDDASPDEDAVFYLQRALAPGDGFGSFLPQAVRADALATRTELNQPDGEIGAIVLTGLRGLGRRGRERLAGYVRGGGGLLVVGGDGLEPALLNDLFEGDLDLGLGEPVTHAAPVALVSQAPRHPIVRGLGSVAGALGEARFRRTRPLVAGSGLVLARFGDGGPALVEHTVGAGRILVFGAGLGGEWSDFPRRVAFVPFLHETLRYLTSGESSPRASTVGDQPADAVSQPGVITRVDGQRRVVVNVDPRESDPSALTAEQFAAAIGTPSQVVERQGPDPPSTRESGPRLWRALLVLMLLVLVAEGLLARRMA